MAENNSNDRQPQLNLPWPILQNFQQNMHHVTNSSPLHIQDLHRCVVQGLNPLLANASLSTNQHSLRSWPRHHGLASSTLNGHYMSLAHESHVPTDAVTTGEDYVIQMDGNRQETSAPEVLNASRDSQLSNADSIHHNNSETNATDAANALRSSPEIQFLMSFAEKYVPFLLILLMKVIFDHRIGILVIIGLFITFCHANSVVKREVGKQAKRHMTSLLMVFINLFTCIIFIYVVLAEEGLAYALIFVAPYSSPVNIWEVLWITSVTDFVLRIITVLFKILILALPARLIAFQKKGKHYLFIERTSQLYRTVAPMQHWLYFFSESYSGPSKVFGVILSAAYLFSKCKSIAHKMQIWKKTLVKVIQNKTYGVTPSADQIKKAGEACPICQDDYKSPSMLQCKHIFCEDCVALWFDRERTCPICRAQIADDPSWRDGSTTLMMQIF